MTGWIRIIVCSLNLLLFLPAMPARAETVPLWGRWQQVFTAASAAAPETEFSVELASPSGTVHSIWGFWDGGTA
jgi:hypothetical protein